MKIFAAVGALLSVSCSLVAQDFGGFAKLAAKLDSHFGPLTHATNYSATIHAEVLTPEGVHRMSFPSRVARDSAHSRQDILLSEMQDLPETARTAFKQLGFDTLSVIINREEQKAFILQTTARAYCEMPFPEEEYRANEPKDLHLNETPAGLDEADGYECTKYRMVDLKHTNEVATIWRATRLDGFPIKIETLTPRERINIKFSKIDTKPPAPDTFRVPADFTKVADTKALLLQAIRQRNPQAGQPKK